VGNPAEAREAYRRFVDLAPSRFATQKVEAERRLQELK
jgi:hypothetical protein